MRPLLALCLLVSFSCTSVASFSSAGSSGNLLLVLPVYAPNDPTIITTGASQVTQADGTTSSGYSIDGNGEPGGNLTASPTPQQSGSQTSIGQSGGNAKADQFVANLGTQSTGQCGKYGRQLLGDITGNSTFNNNGIPGGKASGAGPWLEQNGMHPIADTGQYQDADTRIYQGGRDGNGHWETYYKGSWHSDFNQQRSGVHNIGSYYTGAQLYRVNG